jgi:drug/metabolite transporter (DMT)-like permease
MLALGLALGASVAWGGSDFLAGLATRRLGVLRVLVLSQGVGLVALLALVAVAGRAAPSPSAALEAAGAGLAELAGFWALYRSLALGPMSVVAPLSSLAAVVPIVVGVGGGERPSAGCAAGLALALAGGVLVALEHEPPGAAGPARRRIAPGACLALASALAFGTFFVAMGAAARSAGPAWAVAMNRTASVAVLILVLAAVRRPLHARRCDLRAAGAIGLLDAGANGLFAVALTEGLASTVSVLGALYPVTTVVLATIALRERVHRAQALGVAAVLAGVGLVSAAGAA